jgi:hypothetical protein
MNFTGFECRKIIFLDAEISTTVTLKGMTGFVREHIDIV